MYRVKLFVILLIGALLSGGCEFPLYLIPSSPFSNNMESDIEAEENVTIHVVNENGAPLSSLPIALISSSEAAITNNLLFSSGSFSSEISIYNTTTDRNGKAIFSNIKEGEYIILAGLGITGNDKNMTCPLSLDLGTGEIYYPHINTQISEETTIVLKQAPVPHIYSDTLTEDSIPIIKISNNKSIKTSWSDKIEDAKYAIIVYSSMRGVIFYYPDNPDSFIEDTLFEINDNKNIFTEGIYHIIVAKITSPDSINPAYFEILPSEPLLGTFKVILENVKYE